MKVKNDHRSEFSNLSNWKEEAFMFSYKAIDLWHDIPSYLKDLSTYSFVKEVKQYLTV